MKTPKDIEWLLWVPILIAVALVIFATNIGQVKNDRREFSFTLYATQNGQITKLTVSPLFDIKGLSPKNVEIYPITNHLQQNVVSTDAIKIGPDGIEPIKINIPYQVTGIKAFADGVEVVCYENDDVFIIPAYTIVPRKFTCVNHP